MTLDAVLDTARTLPRSAVTFGHPPVTRDNPKGFVNAKNVEKLGVGDIDGAVEVGGVKRNGDAIESDYEDAQGAFVKVKYAVRRHDAIEAIEAGHRETSCGYDVVTDETPGDHPIFGRYDARQISRTCNHDAVGIPKGRAGASVSMRIDGADVLIGGQLVELPASKATSTTSADASAARPTAPPANKAGNNRADTHEVSMKPGLLALLAALGVQRFDSEEAACEAALPIAKKAMADQADAIQLRKDAEEMAAEEEKEESDLDKAKKDLKAAQDKIGELEGQLGAMKKAEADRKDAVELADLQKVATKLKVKHDGLLLPALRLAIAKTRVDSLDDKTAPAIVDGVLMGIKAEVAKADAAGEQRKDERYDFGGNDPSKQDADPKGQRRDELFNPFLDAADKARADSFKGGEA